MNVAGQAIGSSTRFNGGSADLGQDAWFYDLATNQTFALQLSSRSDGYASSSGILSGRRWLGIRIVQTVRLRWTTILASGPFGSPWLMACTI